MNVRTHGSTFPLDGTFPDHTLPVAISKVVHPDDLIKAVGWRELTVMEWLTHVVGPGMGKAEFNLSTSVEWADRVLLSLARAWPSLSAANQESVATILKNRVCIRTQVGLKTPEQSYFQSAHIFPDLPVMKMSKVGAVKGNLLKVLEAIGVRKHVEMQIIFDR